MRSGLAGLELSTANSVRSYDVVVVGGGASGLMCAIQAGYKGLRVLVLERAQKVGLKILVSGGGRCNFTNLLTDPEKHFLSANAHFCISALRRYPPEQFIALVEAHGIDYHEKKLGQQFCDHSAQDIVDMLLLEAQWANVEIRTNCSVEQVKPHNRRGKDSDAENFTLRCRDTKPQAAAKTQSAYTLHAPKVVIASGGLSMPKVATDFALRTADQLGLKVVAPAPALVPLTWNSADKELFSELSGISIAASVACAETRFDENILFTHRGLSGPGILQISSYWQPGDTVQVNMLPEIDFADWLEGQRRRQPRQHFANALKSVFPNRLVETLSGHWFDDQRLADLDGATIKGLQHQFTNWSFRPGGSEGYRTAEVTLGGISTDEFSSKTFESRQVPGLYAIGEALDVTGWLGGYNFQWAWASAYACAQALE